MTIIVERRQLEEEVKEAYESGNYTEREIANLFAISTSTVREYSIPGEREKTKSRQKEYRRLNKTYIRKYQRDYYRKHGRGRCRYCANPMSRNNGICKSCRDLDMEWRWIEIRTYWNNGLTVPEISNRMKISQNSITYSIRRMRELGWDLPIRYKGASNTIKIPL